MSNIKHLGYRISQFFSVGVGMSFVSLPSPKLLTGIGSVKKLPELVKGRGIDKVMMVTDKELLESGLLDSLFEACDQEDLTYVLFDEVTINPTVELVEKAQRVFVDQECQALIAFGGRSPIDCAKVTAALVAQPSKRIAELEGDKKVATSKIPPIFAVPTTAGTGSEATMTAVVTSNDLQHRYVIRDTALLPSCIVLDADLTTGLPPRETAIAGFASLSRAIEAYMNKYVPKEVLAMSEQATKLVFENLPHAYRDGNDLRARENMQIAAYFAGRSVNRARVGYVHAIAHTLGDPYKTEQGLTNAILLPYVLEDYGDAAYDKLARLADVVGIVGKDNEEKSDAFIAAIRKMEKEMGIPDKLHGVQDKDIPAMARAASKEANPDYSVPAIWDNKQFERTIRRARSEENAYFITEKCVGCTLCAKNCPVFAIEGKLKERHVINPKRCVGCGTCGNVCNFGAILDSTGNVAKKTPKKEWKKPVVDETLCSACSMCVNVCGRDCLSISMPKFKGDIHVFAWLSNEKQCVGCGLCESICPVHAITMKGGK